MKLLIFVLSLVTVFVIAAFGSGQLVPQPAGYRSNYEAGSITGSTLADLYNISWTDTRGSLHLSDQPSAGLSQNIGFVDHMPIRAAFSIRAAVILMDEYDQMWAEKLGAEVFSGVPGTDFNSANLEAFRGYFDAESEGGIAIHLGTDYNDTDGDISGNKTLNEDSYRAVITAESFVNQDYDGLNESNVENLNTLYSDLTDLLLETEEKDTDWQDSGNDVVAAGHSNAEAVTLDVLRAGVSDIADVPISAIRIDNYTIANLYLEQVMSQSLGDDIQQAYQDAKSAGFISVFRATTPLKVSRVTQGPALRGLDPGTLRGVISTPKAVTSERTHGSTAVTNSLAFKDQVTKGSTSALTGLKEKALAGFFKITGWIAEKTGSQKILAKAMTWFSGLSTKNQYVVIIIFYVIIFLIIAVILFYLMKLARRVTRPGRRR